MSEEVKKNETKVIPQPNNADLERRLLELRIRKEEAETQDLEERLAEREMKRETKRQSSVSKGQILRQNKAAKQAEQDRCSHRKGGNGLDGVVGGQGDDSQYSVMKHRFHWGDVWVRCLRCAKCWKPPVKKNFTKDGKFEQAAYDVAMKEYQLALAFPTRNSMSSSSMFQYQSLDGSDAKEVVREIVDNSDFQ